MDASQLSGTITGAQAKWGDDLDFNGSPIKGVRQPQPK
jgi:hypothetical protein